MWDSICSKQALKLCFLAHILYILKGAEGTASYIHIRNKQEGQKVQVEHFALNTMSSPNHEEQRRIFTAGS